MTGLTGFLIETACRGVVGRAPPINVLPKLHAFNHNAKRRALVACVCMYISV